MEYFKLLVFIYTYNIKTKKKNDFLTIVFTTIDYLNFYICDKNL